MPAECVKQKIAEGMSPEDAHSACYPDKTADTRKQVVEDYMDDRNEQVKKDQLEKWQINERKGRD